MSRTLRLVPFCPTGGQVFFTVEPDWSPRSSKKRRAISRQWHEEKRRLRRVSRQEVRRAHLVEQ